MARPAHKKHSKALYALIFLAVFLVIFRLCLPTIVTRYTNRALNQIPGYTGHLEGVRIHLWRGAYSLEDLSLAKTQGHIPVPLFHADEINFSINGRALFHRQLVASIVVEHPTVNFVESAEPEGKQTSDKDWRTQVKAMFPLRISQFRIHEGEIHFRNYDATPPVDVYLNQMNVTISNLTNSKEFSNTLKATVDGQAHAMTTGLVKLRVEIDPFAAKPTFNIKFLLEHLDLASLNGFFKYYLAVEAKTGTLDFYLEGAARQGQFDGYAKPLLEHLDLLHIKERASMGEILKGFAVKLMSYTFKNHPKDRLATRIPITGTVNSPDLDTWSALTSFLKNWIVRAIVPGFEKSAKPQ